MKKSGKENKNRILFVTQTLACGGAETVLVNIANNLSRRGYSVTILCYEKAEDLVPSLDSNVRYIYKPRREFPILRKIPYIKRFYKYRKAVWEHRVSAKGLYKYYVGKEKYDIEIGFLRGAAIKIVSGSTNKKSKKFAWVHTDFKLCNPKSIMGWFNNSEEVTDAYGRMDKIFCVSDKARESFNEVIGLAEKTVTLYNLIPSEKIIEKSYEEIPLNKEKFTVMTVSRLIPDKRHERLLSAVKKLTDEGYDFDVWIVGRGVQEEYLKKYCVDKNIRNVTFTGMQLNPYPYMRKADLFVLSSLREGFALVIPEAMACGLPVLSTSCTGPVEILKNGEYGMLVDNNDESIYYGLKNVLDNPEQLDYFREKSAERYKDFDEKIIIRKLINIFEITKDE